MFGEKSPQSIELSLNRCLYFIKWVLCTALCLDFAHERTPPIPHHPYLGAWSLAAINTVSHPQIKFFKITTPTPQKISKKFQGTMSNVGHGTIKKSPGV